MASLSVKVRRRVVHFTDHALDRWWEREDSNFTLGRRDALALLRERLNEARPIRHMPVWARVSLYHRARLDHFINLGDDSGFVVNRNANGDYVAVTYIHKQKKGEVLR